jgi:hypothetical protein
MQANEQLIEKFYTAFRDKDYETMKACYLSDAEFSDPVFPCLKGKQIGAMWHMLCLSGKDLQIIWKDIQADDKTGSCKWEAVYTFSATGRKVHNKISSSFEFQNGLIKLHKDKFDLYRWSAMALGPKGILTGWLPAVKQKIRNKVDHTLSDFIKNNPEYL